MKKTGRVFKCIGLKENLASFWNKSFELNILYYEVKTKTLKSHDSFLLLKTEFTNKYLFVDKDQFELQENE